MHRRFDSSLRRLPDEVTASRNEQVLACWVEGDNFSHEHQLWIERDFEDGVVTFDCPQCDYWQIVRGHPTVEQLIAMQLVAVWELGNCSCKRIQD